MVNSKCSMIMSCKSEVYGSAKLNLVKCCFNLNIQVSFKVTAMFYICSWISSLVSLRVISWTVSVGSRRRTFLRALWTWWGVWLNNNYLCDFSHDYKWLHISDMEAVWLHGLSVCVSVCSLHILSSLVTDSRLWTKQQERFYLRD